MSVKGQEKGNEWGERGVRAQRGDTREKSWAVEKQRAYRISLLLFTLCFFLLYAVPALKLLKEEGITKC